MRMEPNGVKGKKELQGSPQYRQPYDPARNRIVFEVLYEDMVSGLVDKDDFFLWKKNYEDKMSSAKAELAECEK